MSRDSFISNILVDGATRDAIVRFFEANCGDLGSSKVHADLRPWRDTIIRIGKHPSMPISFPDFVALDKFRNVIGQLNGQAGLPAALVGQYATIQAAVKKRVDEAPESFLLRMIQYFVQDKDFVRKIKAMRKDLAKGKEFPNVARSMEEIDAFLKALEGLSIEGKLDACYEPQMDRLLAEIAKGDSPLHDKNKIFARARRICKYVADEPLGAGCFNEHFNALVDIGDRVDRISDNAWQLKNMIQI